MSLTYPGVFGGPGPKVPAAELSGAIHKQWRPCSSSVEHPCSVACMGRTIGFRPTEDDERIIREARHAGEGTSDVLRRALHLLNRETWLAQARADAERLADEDLSGEEDAW